MENESFFRSIVEHATDIVWRVDRDFGCVYVNPAFEHASGIDLKDVIGKTLRECDFSDELKERLEGAFREMLEAGKYFEVEFSAQEPDGEKSYHAKFIPEFGPDGEVETALIVMRDVTARATLQSQLRRYREDLERLAIERSEELSDSEEKYHSLIENIPDVTWTTKRGGSTVFISNNIKRVFGYTQDEINADPNLFLPRIHPDDHNRVTKAFDAMFEKGVPFDVEYRIQRKDGEWIWLHDRAITTYKKDGEVYADGVLYDFTDRKRAEDELVDWKDRYEAAVVASGNVLYDWDAATNEVTYGGDVEGILGYGPDEMKGGLPHWESLIHPEDRGRFETRIRHLIETGEHALFEYRVRRKDGSYIHVEDRGNFIRDAEGNPKRMLGFVSDITDRKRAEFEQHKLASVVRYSSELMNLATPDGRMVFLNDAGRELLGLAVDEVSNTNIIDVIPDHLKDKVKREVVPAILRGDGWSGDIQYLNRRTGGVRDVHVTTFLIRDPATDAPLYLANVSMDITDRKRAEGDLRESEEKLRMAFEGAKDAIFWADPQTGILFNCNKSAERLLEKTRDEILGRSQLSLHPQEDAERYVEIFRGHVEAGRGADIEAEVLTKSGKRVPVHITASVTGVGGKGVIQGLFRDITDRKRAEEALKSSEERFRQIAENAMEFIWEVDADGLYTYVSPVVEELLGYRPEEVVGKKHFYDFFHRDERQEMKVGVFETFAKKQSFREFPNRNVHKDGRDVWLLTSGVPILDEGGGLLGYRGADKDITQSREIEFMKQKLMRDVTHSLKTPVAMMEMAMEIHSVGVKADDMSRVKKAERIMSDNVKLMHDDLDKMVQMNALDILKGKRGGMVRRSSLKAAVTRSLKNIGPLIERKGLDVRVDISKGAERVAVAREDLMVLVNNLLDNAVKFTESGGITITGRVRGKGVEMVFADTGKGMSPDELRMSCERFYQVHSAAIGTGLGLAINKEIVGIYGGSIALESKGRGKGTTVSIVLPR